LTSLFPCTRTSGNMLIRRLIHFFFILISKKKFFKFENYYPRAD
jgi:hypothetical protein